MSSTPEEALKILDVVAQNDLHDCIFWRCDGKYAPITIWINCNDLFCWATADLEEITVERLPEFERAIADCEVIDPVLGALRGCDLFCCRMRGMRPQRPAYPTDKPEWKAIFDSCGPERDPKDEG